MLHLKTGTTHYQVIFDPSYGKCQSLNRIKDIDFFLDILPK